MLTIASKKRAASSTGNIAMMSSTHGTVTPARFGQTRPLPAAPESPQPPDPDRVNFQRRDQRVGSQRDRARRN